MTRPPPAPEPKPGPALLFRKLRRVLVWPLLVLILVFLFSRVPLERVIAEFYELEWARMSGLCALSFVFIIGVSIIDGTAMWCGFRLFEVRIEWKEITLVRAAMMLLATLSTPVGQAGLAAHIAAKHRIKAGPAAGMVSCLFMLEVYGMIALSTIFLPVYLLTGETAAGAPLETAVIMTALAWPVLAAVLVMGRRAAGTRLFQKLRLAPILHPLSMLSFPDLVRLLAIKTALAGWQIGLTVAAFRIYGIEASPRDLYAFMPLAILVSSIPVAPGRLGITQVSWVYFFGYMASEPALVALSLLLQFILNLARWMVGAAALPFVYKDLGVLGRKYPNNAG